MAHFLPRMHPSIRVYSYDVAFQHPRRGDGDKTAYPEVGSGGELSGFCWGEEVPLLRVPPATPEPFQPGSGSVYGAG